MTEKEKKAWQDMGEKIMLDAYPDLEKHVESKEAYTPAHVCNLTRDQVLPGQGGECIGLGQWMGQCARTKPSVKAPVRGLFFVGCDAGGYGVGTQQAVDSAINVAEICSSIPPDARGDPVKTRRLQGGSDGGQI